MASSCKKWALLLWVLPRSILLYVLLYLLITAVLHGEHNYKEYVGNRVVLDKDTLSIVNYNFKAKRFILDNGKVINSSLVFKARKDKLIILN